MSIFFALVFFSTAYSTILASQPLLTGGRDIGVASYNMFYKCPDAGFIKLIEQSIKQGNSWEIIGFQEMRFSEKKCFAPNQFIDEMKKIGLNYQCKIQSKPNVDDINVVICSQYPLNEASYIEQVVHSYGPRVMQCIEVLVPGNPLIVCNTHTKTSKFPNEVVQQLRIGIDFIINTASYHFIPANITDPAEKLIYRTANLARTIVVGDFNTGSKNAAPFMTTCRKSDAEGGCYNGSLGIDHITTADMVGAYIGAQPPLNQEFLQPVLFFRDRSLAWTTDHLGPVLAKITIKKLDVPINSRNSGDLDVDGDVDVFDYNLLMSMFGKTGTAGFHPADIIQNGVIDIFDYNALVESLGR